MFFALLGLKKLRRISGNIGQRMSRYSGICDFFLSDIGGYYLRGFWGFECHEGLSPSLLSY